MGRFQLQSAPTFKAKVGIPIPGSDPARVEFTFKHRTRDELKLFMETVNDMDDVKLVMSVASGWELVDEFSEENVKQLVQDHLAAPREIFETYLRELVGNRTKN